MIPEGICFHPKGKGLGDQLVAALAAQVLIDNGLGACVYLRRSTKRLITVPWYNLDKHSKFWMDKAGTGNPRLDSRYHIPLILIYLNRAEQILQTTIHFDKQKHNHTPVLFYDNPDIPMVDVVLCTETGSWTPYRNWPYFNALKQKLDERHITYIDLNKNEIRGNDCLNYVKKCKVYVGLETGTSHYVSKFANGKGLILQGGFFEFEWWAYPYDYEAIVAEIPCSKAPCYLNKYDIEHGQGCPFHCICMEAIPVDAVLDKILQRL